jgi:hypothetical protein
MKIETKEFDTRSYAMQLKSIVYRLRCLQDKNENNNEPIDGKGRRRA